jgi:hypothetical protein
MFPNRFGKVFEHNMYMMKKLTLTLMAIGVFAFGSFAQEYDDYDSSYDDYGYDDPTTGAPYDSTATDSMTDDYGYDDDSSWDDDESGNFNGIDYVRSARPKFEHRPYERFSGMPYDSATELVTYVEVVDVVTPDDYLGEPFDYADSLYARASKWLGQQFGKKQAKKMLKKSGPDRENREGLTIKSVAELPLMVEHNKFSTGQSGVIQFDLELRFKDGRYRYKFNNFVHVEEDHTTGNDPISTYIEYYMDAKTNVEENDQVLIATNNQMNVLIEDLKSACADVPFVDDDDW